MSSNIQEFESLKEIAEYFREILQDKKYILLFAYNGTGKTRLSMEFRELGKMEDNRDTLYFNAFTEDLFFWDNDLENDSERVLKMNTEPRFFNVFKEGFEIESGIRKFLHRYYDFDFTIDYEKGTINFFRDIVVKTESGEDKTERIENIKISRGEENTFIWCFFLAIAQLAIEEQEAYSWVKYIYIDDPISSLDDNNAVAIATHLAQMLKGQDRIKLVISSHHTLFFNVMWNELKNAQRFYLRKEENKYKLYDTKDTPRFYHVAMLQELNKVAKSGEIYTYHFTILRSILEKTSTFHGYNSFSALIKKDANDEDDIIYTRIINLLSHGNYSMFEPVEMLEENKEYFRKILNDFMNDFKFNPEIFKDVL